MLSLGEHFQRRLGQSALVVHAEGGGVVSFEYVILVSEMSWKGKPTPRLKCLGGIDLLEGCCISDSEESCDSNSCCCRVTHPEFVNIGYLMKIEAFK